MKRYRRRLRVETLEDRVAPAGNILVNVGNFANSTNTIEVINQSGTVVQTFTPPADPNEHGAFVRDVAVSPNADISVYNGTFSPVLSTLNPSNGSWSNLSQTNWSTVNNITYGGLAAFGNYVYATDMQTGLESAPDNGIVRFNIANGTVQRFAAGTDYIQITLGLNGVLYALQAQNGSGNKVDEFNPTTMAYLGTVNLTLPDPRGIAVAANGTIYAADWGKTVYELSPNGNILNSVTLSGPGSGVGHLGDIHISTDGQLVVGSYSNIVTLLNSNLSGVTYLTVGSSTCEDLFVSYADYQAPAAGPTLSNIEVTPLTFVVSQGPTNITQSLTVSDGDSTTIIGATVAITSGFAAGEDVLGFSTLNGITGTYNSATGVLTLSGIASLLAYQSALQSVTYQDTSLNPNSATRTITFQFEDTNQNFSNTQSRNVSVFGHTPPALSNIESSPLNYQARQAPTAVTNSLTVSDSDSATIASAVVSISSGFAAGEDVLGFVNQNGITGNYNADTGVLTLAGTASLAAYQAALQSVTYSDTSLDPNNATRTITFQVNDGFGANNLSNTQSRNIAVFDHIPPALSNIESSALAYQAGQAATTIAASITVSDPDSATLVGATVAISSGFVPGEDVLGFAIQNGISGSYNSATGVLTLNGTATLANYQAALRSVTYGDSSLNPNTATRTISFQVNDGFGADNLSNIEARNITVTDHIPPALANIETTALAYQAGQSATNITASLTVADPDSATIASATVAITSGFVATDDALGFVNQNGITGSYNSATGVLTLSGTSSLANYQAALRSVTYRDTNLNPSSGMRTVSFQVNDGFGANALSNIQSRSISITGHAAPVLANIESPALSFTEGNSPEAITSALTVTDSNSATIAGATVSISASFAGAEDVLAFANQNGITGSYNSTTGVLTLSGVASVANYQTALQSVSYADTSANPSTATRTVTFQVDDGFAFNHASNTQSRNISVVAVNTPPTLTLPGAGSVGGINADLTLLGISTADVDANGGKEDLTLSALNGNLRFNSLTGITIDGGANNSPSLTVGGSIAQLNTALANGNLIYHPNSNFLGNDLLSFLLNDNGNTGIGGPKTVQGSLKITVTNHVAPVLANIETTALSFTEGNKATAITSALTVTDSNSTTLTGATVWISQNFAGVQDVLGFANQNGITGSYNASTGVLTLSGTASVAAYQMALRSVTYLDNSQNPSTATRTISFKVNDGAAINNISNVASRNVTVIAVNNPPVLALPSSGPSGAPNVAIAVTGISVSDVDANGGVEKLTLTVLDGAIGFVSLTGVTVVAGANNSATVTVQGTIAQLNAALGGHNLAYQSKVGFSGTDTLNLTINDNGNTGTGGAKTATGSFQIHISHTAPVLAGIETTTLVFTEGNAATPITAALTVTDVSSATINSATVSISGGYVTGQDVLGFATQNGISGSFNATTGVLTLSGTASVANYQTALRSVTYLDNSQNPSTATRTVTFKVNDGASSNNLSNTQSRTISVVAVNTPPTLTLPATPPSGIQNSSIAINGMITADVDANGGKEDLTLTVKNGTIHFKSLNGITIDAGANGSTSVTVGGTIAQLNAALANGNLVYQSNSNFSGAETLALSLNDNGNTGTGGPKTATASLTITVSPHVAPVLANIETTALSFTEGNKATAISSALTISDSDSTTLIGATVKISQNFAGAEDVLGFANQNGIAGSYNTATGVLTLSGAATLAQYQLALRSVTYIDNSQNPSTASRTISFQVNDGASVNNLSNIATRNVTVIAVNTPPVLAVPPSASGLPNADLVVNGIFCSDVDANGGVETLTLTVSHGTIRFASLNGLTVTGGANNTSTITVNGTLAQLNAALASGNLIYHGAAGFTSTDTLSLTLNDNGNTGTGGGKSTTASVAIQL